MNVKPVNLFNFPSKRLSSALDRYGHCRCVVICIAFNYSNKFKQLDNFSKNNGRKIVFAFTLAFYKSKTALKHSPLQFDQFE